MEYKLENDFLSVVFKTKGGELTSIKDQKGTEYLWQGDPQYWSGQAPIVFPICGSIRDNKAVTEDGRKLSMPRHGIARKEEFIVESIDKESICFSLTSNEKLFAMYPYKFKLFITYKLEKNKIRVIYEVLNNDTVKMPFFIGGHPAFNCPLEEGADYTDYEIIFDTEETCAVPALSMENGLLDTKTRTPLLNGDKKLQLSKDLFKNDALVLDQLKSRKVTYTHSQKKQGLELEFQQCPYLLLWSSANDGQFIAIEPWTGISTCDDEGDIFEEKRNVTFAEPGEKKTIEYDISILG